MHPDQCCILNAGIGAWAFADFAQQLSDALWIDVSEKPRAYNYLLSADDPTSHARGELFISYQSMEIASDKRTLARLFSAHNVSTPETHLLETSDEVRQLLRTERDKMWCLKFPTGCGAAGHRVLTEDVLVPKDWPRPLVVQEFIRLERPEVYRLYAVAGNLFGWVVRRFPDVSKTSPWVAHARGARYQIAGDPPHDAVEVTRAALFATGLLSSFGCADLLQRSNGEWLVLEVGTDGVFNHVDRDLGLPAIERELQHQIAEAFWRRAGALRPWSSKWRPRNVSEDEMS